MVFVKAEGKSAADLPKSPVRRKLMAALAAAPLIGASGLSAAAAGTGGMPKTASRERIRALMISATTLSGRGSLEHAAEELRDLYADVSRILLINFASLPEDRDAYAVRMQRDFSRIDERFKVDSLHAVKIAEARRVVREAEAVFVSGGNTFLLLRELYDRDCVELLSERVFGGLPYAGSSAGSNLAGIEIGTTNDFPITDVPTRRSLGILAAVFNPHHPDADEEAAYGSRQWKIRQYARYNPDKPVLGVTNAGLVRIRGEELTQRGVDGLATVQLGSRHTVVTGRETGNISSAMDSLRSPQP
jgi:dipeptidase E